MSQYHFPNLNISGKELDQRAILSPTGFILPTDCEEVTAD